MSLPQVGWTISTSNGPTSAEEAKVLWSEGRSSYESQNFSDTILALQRLVDRYPGNENFDEAQWILGKAYLRNHQADRAIKPLRYYTEAMGKSQDGTKARIELGEAYLALNKFNETYLTALEIQKRAKQFANTPAEYAIEGLILKSLSLLGKKKPVPAKQARDSARAIFSKAANLAATDLGPHLAWLDLQVKSYDCGLLPSSSRLTEDQAIDQINRKGQCVVEAALPYLEALRTGDLDWSQKSTNQISKLADQFQSSCLHPPKPAKKVGATQESKYLAELKDRLKKDCRSNYSKLLDLMQNSKDKLPNSVLPQLNQLSEQITQLRNS